MLAHRRVRVQEEREAGFEVHVHDETQARHEPQRRQEIGDAGITAASEIKTEKPERDVQQRHSSHRYVGKRSGPLPTAILEVIDELLDEQGDAATGVVRAGEKHRIVEDATPAELIPADHRHQVFPCFRV